MKGEYILVPPKKRTYGRHNTGQMGTHKMNGECTMQQLSFRYFLHIGNPDLDAFLRSQKRMCPGLKGHRFTLGHAFLETVLSEEKHFKTQHLYPINWNDCSISYFCIIFQ